ncbi:MAG: tetratricopeptide repeat protein [Desulfovibrio sp.]|jgi:tetratricopeptide (TPR) repeat protein|nr:tetratricopeptide repeat protein [Desulfovibrio sp.]
MLRRILQTLFVSIALAAPASLALAQSLPQDCQEAMEVRSPQAQVELFSRCLDSGSLSGATKATTLKQRAVAYMHLGQHQRAIDDVTEAMKIKPGDPDVYYLRGLAKRALGKHQEAIDDSTRAIGMEPKNAGAYANRAFSYKALGYTSQAKSDARRALELDPRVKVPSF